MPVRKCPDGKYRIGSGQCMYDTKEKALAAYGGYRAKKYSELVKNFRKRRANG